MEREDGFAETRMFAARVSLREPSGVRPGKQPGLAEVMIEDDEAVVEAAWQSGSSRSLCAAGQFGFGKIFRS